MRIAAMRVAAIRVEAMRVATAPPARSPILIVTPTLIVSNTASPNQFRGFRVVRCHCRVPLPRRLQLARMGQCPVAYKGL